VARGEVWRVLSGMLLHANASHLASNLFSLLSFGMLLERRFGRWRVAAICLASWVLGGIFAAFSPILTIVGAPGIAFGLMGAWLSQLLGMRDLPSSRLSLGASAAILMYQLALGIFAPGISFLTHLGGFLAGTALGLWYVQRIDLANAAPSQSRPLRSGVAVCATLLVALASYGLTRRSGLDFAAELRRELAQGPAHEDTARLDRAMLWASLIAQDPGAAAADLELARTPLEQGAARYTYGSPALDVLAMLRFRTGDHEGAVAAQLESVARRVRRSSLRELLRGDADALFARLGVYLAAAPRAPHGGNPLDSIRFNRTHDGRALDLELSEPEPRGSILYLIAYEKERPSGILGMRFTSASGSVRMTLPLLVPTSARLELVYTAQARVLPPRNESRYVLLRGDAVSFLAPPPG
jgi:hypothetical protein